VPSASVSSALVCTCRQRRGRDVSIWLLARRRAVSGEVTTPAYGEEVRPPSGHPTGNDVIIFLLRSASLSPCGL